MTPCELLVVLKEMFSRPTRENALFITGKPGVGKTALVAQVAQTVGKQLITFALPTCESVDLRGIPQVVNGQTRWASPMPRDGEGVLLLDELSSAAPDVQVAAHHLVWAEAGSDMSLPRGWHIVLTGNQATDRTLYRAVSGPLRNRLTTIQLEPDLEQWVTWAMSQDIHASIPAFLRWRPALMIAKEIPADGAFPSLRAWTRVSSIVQMRVTAKIEHELLVGTVGEAAAAEYVAFLRMARELPNINGILKEPGRAAVPSAPDVLYALTTNLVYYTRTEGKSAMSYVKRLPAEFALLYIRDIRDYFDIREDADVREWIGKHKKLFRDE